ncbi:MAG: hypothetical protein B7Y80_18655 [Hyphomicrobium sp. 32-62-53]|nr:MAG: hypothetical protein B7Z29_19740 [Hyphomicrobium sp. 12-62-95]OYX97765.1 MAG: hypothetical protein B7Y80_18655 [Hyphomicrobium sp. 32-62-53]
MIPDRFDKLSSILKIQLQSFPEHENYLKRRFSGEMLEQLEFCEFVAGMIFALTKDDIKTFCDDYAWLSRMVIDEEVHFRRHSRYRLSSFAEAFEQVYSNNPFMTKYMNGLLMTQLWWRNHTEVLRFFRDSFLAGGGKDRDCVEIGPGHGLLLGMTVASDGCRSAEGWDISEASLANTSKALADLGVDLTKVTMREVNLFNAPEMQFDRIVFSEVLEHLEEPQAALQALFKICRPGGRIFVHAPVNSPAPDHLYLFRTPEEVVDMVSSVGFEILDTRFEPCTGASLARARKLDLTISAAVVARRS